MAFLGSCLVETAVLALKMAFVCLKLDAQLLDLREDDWENAGYCLPLNNVRINTTYQNDDHAEQCTLFCKDELRMLLDLFELNEYILVPQN